MDREYCVISHTHWDREWYLPFEQFRLRLVSLMDHLIELMEKEERYIFHLDAQTVVLEDYLEIKPCMRERLKKLITGGRLWVGPWYVQNDFNLVSGESTIRNLLIGTKIAEEYGKCMKVGYAPDQFGLIAQLPQIFSKFGIDSCIFGRGKESYGTDPCGKPVKRKEQAEFYWNSEDGSRILGIFLPFWYNNAQRFSENIDKALYLLTQNGEQLAETSATPYFLLMNGVDHLEAQENLLPILDQLNTLLPMGHHVGQMTLPDYIARVKGGAGIEKLAQYTGEMRSGEDRNLLQGTLSTRVLLKQMNARCQQMLENCLEPLYTWLHIAGIGEYPHGCIQYLWKLLIRNHAHDSICGCHIDAVTAHMEDRFHRVEEGCESLIGSALELFSLHIDRSHNQEEDYLLSFFNTVLGDRRGIVDVEIQFDKTHQVKDFAILNMEGKNIAYRLLEKREKKVRRFSPINLPGVVDVDSFLIRMQVENVPAQGYVTYTVRPGEKGVLPYTAAEAGRPDHTLENGYLRVQIHHNGTIDLLHKETGVQYRGLLLLEDREDIGDSYNFIPSDTGYTIRSDSFEPRIYPIEEDPFTQRYGIEYNMRLPMKYDYVIRQRSQEESCTRVKIVLQLDAGCPYVKATVHIDNQAKDHRIRALFPTGVATEFTHAGAPFAIVKRDKAGYNPEINHTNEQPFTGFVAIEDENQGVAFFANGLYEYENLRDESNTLAITLLRGNECIYKSEGHSDPEDLFVIPENQCMGMHSFELAIYPYSGGWNHAMVIKKSQECFTPLLDVFRPVNQERQCHGSAFVQDAAISEIFSREDRYRDKILPSASQFINLIGRDIEISALKANEERNSIILRLYNSSSEYREADIQLDFPVNQSYITDLKEERKANLLTENHRIKGIGFKPKEIVTIEVVKA